MKTKYLLFLVVLVGLSACASPKKTDYSQTEAQTQISRDEATLTKGELLTTINNNIVDVDGRLDSLEALPEAITAKAWSSARTYSIGDLVTDPTVDPAKIYISKTNGNLNNLVSDGMHWEEPPSSTGSSSFFLLSGEPTDNTALSTALDEKVDASSLGTASIRAAADNLAFPDALPDTGAVTAALDTKTSKAADETVTGDWTFSGGLAASNLGLNMGALTDIKYSSTAWLNDSLAVGGTDDNKHLWSIEKNAAYFAPLSSFASQSAFESAFFILPSGGDAVPDPNAQTGTTYTVLTGDKGKTITATNSSAQIYTLLDEVGHWFDIINRGAGTLSLHAPTSSGVITLNGTALDAGDEADFPANAFGRVLCTGSATWSVDAFSGTLADGGAGEYAGGGALYAEATAVWDFENDATDTIETHDLTNNNAVAFGTTTPPQGSYYASFDSASSQYFSIADDADFDFGGGDYTIAFWANLASTSGGNILAKTDLTNGYLIRNIYTDSNRIRVQNDSAGSSSNADADASVTSTWVHYVVVYSASADTFTIYQSTGSTFDTSPVTASSATNGPGDNSEALTIGKYATGYLNGSLDEMVVWKGKALTSTEAESVFDGTWRE